VSVSLQPFDDTTSIAQPGPRRIKALRETPVFSRVKRVRPLIDRIAAWVGRGYVVGVMDWTPGPIAGLAEAVSACR
jgi:hypothetical protein